MASVVAREAHINQWIPLTLSIWHKAWDDPVGLSFQSLCAKISCVVFPIILVIGCGECIVHACLRVWKICNPVHKPVESVITVDLATGSSQYDIDIPGQRPSACAFHALQAIASIGILFETYAKEIEEGNAGKLSQRQQGIIKNGLTMYRIALGQDSTLLEGANHEHVIKSIPAVVKNCADFGPINEETHPVEVRVKKIAGDLFSEPTKKRTAWIKNGNEEFFSVIVSNDRAIIFDSHKNRMTLIYGQEATQKFLTDKLSEFSHMLDGYDATPFSYAIGTIIAPSTS